MFQTLSPEPAPELALEPTPEPGAAPVLICFEVSMAEDPQASLLEKNVEFNHACKGTQGDKLEK